MGIARAWSGSAINQGEVIVMLIVLFLLFVSLLFSCVYRIWRQIFRSVYVDRTYKQKSKIPQSAFPPLNSFASSEQNLFAVESEKPQMPNAPF